MSVVLVGPMGAGKTTVARLLAEATGGTARDTDPTSRPPRDAASPTSSSTPARTTSACSSAPRWPRPSPSTTACCRSAGERCSTPRPGPCSTDHTVVFLRVGLSEAVKRVGLGSARPLLLGNVRGRIKALLDERTPVYESVADLVVDTDHKPPAEVAEEIRRALP